MGIKKQGLPSSIGRVTEIDYNRSAVTSMSGMFYGCSVFNEDISGWPTSAVTNMNSMFEGATAMMLEYMGYPGR